MEELQAFNPLLNQFALILYKNNIQQRNEDVMQTVSEIALILYKNNIQL